MKCLMRALFIALLLLLNFVPITDAYTPFTVYGNISNYQGAFTNGISVTIHDDNTSQSIKTTTIQGAQHAGFYQVNLGNMATQWNRGHSISVYAEYWSNSIRYYGTAHFNIPREGYIYLLNMTTNMVEFNPGGGGEHLPPAPLGNHMPILSDGKVSPGMGVLNATFWFNVTYIDADNEKPHIISAIIDSVSHSMSFVSFLSGNYTTGAKYSYRMNFLVGGDHTYWFYCNDGYANSSDYTTATVGPHVIYEPILFGWRVSPLSGTPDTNFTYTVTYTDRDGNEPIYIYVSINGQHYNMSKTSGTVKTGETFECILNHHPMSPSIYEIVASDGYYRIATNKYDGPLVINESEPDIIVPPDNTILKVIIIILIAIIAIVTFVILRRRKLKKREREQPGKEQPRRVGVQELKRRPSIMVVRKAK